MQSGGPMGLLAELTHRCPLGCPYCSNPLALEGREGELSTQDWRSVFSQAARLGILQVHLSGGEPAARRDLVELVAHCAAEGLYTNLITSGVGVTETLVADLAAAGLDHVQLSVQDVEPESADRIAGYRGAFERKRVLARTLVEAGFPLTINAVVHKANVARAEVLVDLAIAWGARRVEIAHTQYYGWALSNRGLLLPDRPEAERAIRAVERRKREVEGQIVVDHVLPDYHADRPKACMGGWGRRIMNVTPSGKVLPCHAAESIPGLVFWSVRERSLGEIWTDSPAFNAYRGTAWMKEPCRSCDRREVDFGGCRCQAMMFAGDAAATDPVCSLSPHHALLRQFQQESAPIQDGYVYRRMPKPARATAGETDPTPA